HDGRTSNVRASAPPDIRQPPSHLFADKSHQVVMVQLIQQRECVASADNDGCRLLQCTGVVVMLLNTTKGIAPLTKCAPYRVRVFVVRKSNRSKGNEQQVALLLRSEEHTSELQS